MVLVYISSFFLGIFLQNLSLRGEVFKFFAVLILSLLISRSFVRFNKKFWMVAGFGIVTAFLSVYSSDFIDFSSFNFDLNFFAVFKKDILERLAAYFSPNENAFLAGILLGERESLSPEIVMDFNRTGLTHIMAISGYNVSIVVAFVTRLLSFFSQKIRIFFAIFFVVFFVLFVGASAPVVRAGIMGIIALLALVFNRQYLACNALFISGFLMVIFDPVILYESISFQLSFLATFGLILFSEKFEDFFEFLPEKLFIRQSVVMTMSAQVFVLPIILINFGNLSIVSPLANLLVLPFIPIVMLGGFLVIVFSFFFDFLAFFLSLILHFLLLLILFEISFLADLSFATVDVFWFDFWFALLYYFFALWFYCKCSSLRKIF